MLALDRDGQEDGNIDHDRMTICLIKNIYPPFDRGGAEQVVYQTVQGLLQAGHRVIIITTSPEGDSVEEKDRLTIYRFKPKNIYFYTNAHHYGFLARILWHGIDIFNMDAVRKVQTILKKEQPDIVHTHNLMGLSFLVPRLIRRLGIPHIHTVHDVQLVEPSAIILKKQEHTWRFNGFPTRFYTRLLRFLIGSPHVVISPSQFLLDFYRSRGFFAHSACVVLRNPFTFPYQEMSQKRRVEAQTPLRFLYVGQMEEHKGILLLLKAFRRLIQEKNVQAELHIVGSGGALTMVQTLSRGVRQVFVYGRVGRDDLPALFQKMDVTVVPSLCYENSPTVIFESFSCGVPVLASRVEGIAELIREGENGVTFVTGSEDALVEKMHWCTSHRREMYVMGKNASQTPAGLSLLAYVTKLETLYREATALAS